jgi:hypothetical protein
LLPKGTNTPIGKTSKLFQVYALTLSYTASYETITAASTSAFRKTFTKKYLTAGTYKVRARLYETPLSGSRYGSDVYFEYLEMGVNDGFIYPNTALLAIRALATDQLSGSTPVITCNVTANSDNPSLIAQSILNEVSNITSFDSTFTDFQNECNTQNYKCNIVFDSVVNVRQALDLVTLNGRASIQQFGSKYAVIMDKKDILPTQVFTFGMGNILTDTFKQSYLPINDRANIINVSYYDKDDDYNSIKKNSLLNDHLEYISLQDLINKLPKNIDFNNVLLIKDQYYKDVEFYFVIQNELSIEEQKQKYLKELEVYGEALLEWKEKIDQWEKDKIKHKKDLAEYEIWKNNEKIKSLK